MTDLIEVKPVRGSATTLVKGHLKVFRKQHKAEVRRAMFFILDSLHYVEAGGKIKDLPKVVEIWKGERERLRIKPGKVTRRVNKLIQEFCPEAVRPTVRSHHSKPLEHTNDH